MYTKVQFNTVNYSRCLWHSIRAYLNHLTLIPNSNEQHCKAQLSPELYAELRNAARTSRSHSVRSTTGIGACLYASRNDERHSVVP
jgi:hypothetical protein